MKIKKWSGSAWVQDYPEVNVGAIVATGTPSNTTFLRGDGQWAAPSVGDAQTLDGVDSSQFVRSDVADTVVGNHEFYGTDTGGNYNNAPIEVREVNLVTNTQSSAAYAPSIAWHWGGRVQTQMKLYSSGKLNLEGNHTGQVLTTAEGTAVSASTLATARNIALTGAVTGNANFDGSANISIATTATADPTLTLAGDASGSATFTNLGNATLTVTVADDSHNHIIGNVDGLQAALDGKSSTGHTHTIGELTDVGISNPTSGQVLKWNGLAWTNQADNNTTYTLGSFGLTATATELNYTDGVTSNIQTQLNGKQAAGSYALLSGAAFTGGITLGNNNISGVSELFANKFIISNDSDGNNEIPNWGFSEYNNKPCVSSEYLSDTYYPIYHEGNKPTPADIGAAATSHTHAATDITSGTVATARLGSGTASSTTFLRGDNTWATPASGGGTYSAATLYVKRIWSRTLTGGAWTSRYSAGTASGTAISTTSTFTTIALGYTPASTDQFMIEFSNATSNSSQKGICIVGRGTFTTTAGASVISYDAYETVSGTLRLAKYYAQWYSTGTSLGFRYGGKLVW